MREQLNRSPAFGVIRAVKLILIIALIPNLRRQNARNARASALANDCPRRQARGLQNSHGSSRAGVGAVDDCDVRNRQAVVRTVRLSRRLPQRHRDSENQSLNRCGALSAHLFCDTFYDSPNEYDSVIL